MNYESDGTAIKVGDSVFVEGNVPGLVVCSFDTREAMHGYEQWLEDFNLQGGGKLDSGILVQTEELGILHYPNHDASIKRRAET